MKLCDLFGEYEASSAEYRYLSGFIDIVEIDFAALGVRVCRELRKKYPRFPPCQFPRHCKRLANFLE